MDELSAMSSPCDVLYWIVLQQPTGRRLLLGLASMDACLRLRREMRAYNCRGLEGEEWYPEAYVELPDAMPARPEEIRGVFGDSAHLGAVIASHPVLDADEPYDIFDPVSAGLLGTGPRWAALILARAAFLRHQNKACYARPASHRPAGAEVRPGELRRSLFLAEGAPYANVPPETLPLRALAAFRLLPAPAGGLYEEDCGKVEGYDPNVLERRPRVFYVDDARARDPRPYLEALESAGLLGRWELRYEECNCGRPHYPAWYCRECGEPICKGCCVYTDWSGSDELCHECVEYCDDCEEPKPRGYVCPCTRSCAGD